MNRLSMRACSHAAALCALWYFKTAAGDPADSSSDSSLENITVTATRTAAPLTDVLPSVTLITAEDIESRQILSLQDLFEGEAGVQVSNNGGLGKASSLFLRGANADQVLVLVDGVRMGSATLGTTAFQYLPLDQIGRVEIVRGPLSSLYGSEAMGGVIQIFTKRPTSDGVTFSGDAAAGSHDTSTIGGDIEALSGPLSFGVSASNLASNGYPDCSGAPYVSPSSPGGGCYVYDASPDGYHNVSAAAHLGYRFSEAADIEASVLRAQGAIQYAGDYTNHESFAEQAATLAGHFSPISGLRVTAQAGQSRDDEFDTYNFVEPPGNLFDTKKNSGLLQADWTPAPRQTVTAGGDYLREEISSDTIFPVTSRRVTGVFGEYQGAFGANQFTLSARRDDNSQFGTKTTGSAAWGYHLTEDLRLIASYGTAFHAPTFDDLYYPDFGNSALKPETSRSYEIGVDQRLASSHWSIRAYDSDYRDLIGYDDAQFAPENTDRARIEGAELQGGATAGAWSGEITGTWLNARNITQGSANYGDQLPRRPRASGRLEIARRWFTVRAAARVNVAGPTFDDLANTQPLGGYATADALMEWQPAPRWTLQAKLANFTGHRYQTALYYPQDGRNFLITIRYQPRGS